MYHIIRSLGDTSSETGSPFTRSKSYQTLVGDAVRRLCCCLIGSEKVGSMMSSFRRGQQKSGRGGVVVSLVAATEMRAGRLLVTEAA